DQTLAVRRKADAGNCELEVFEPAHLLASGYFPETQRSLDLTASRGQMLAVGRKSHGHDTSLVAGQSAEFLAGSRIPEAHSFVLAARRQRFSIGRKDDGVDCSVALQLLDFLACRYIPDADGLVSAAGGERSPIG